MSGPSLHETANLLRRVGDQAGDARLRDRALLIETEPDEGKALGAPAGGDRASV